MEESLTGATAVFVGLPMGRSEVRNRKYEYQFKVVSAWKGVDRSEVRVRTGMDTCGVNFDRGRVYLVYAYGDPARLHTNDCTRTTGGNLGHDLWVLGDPVYVGPPISRSEVVKIALIMVGGGCAATGGVILVRRGSSRAVGRRQMA
ncbi:MAG: hypothetical protein ACYS1E_07610 [Planctomycetota bacterium]